MTTSTVLIWVLVFVSLDSNTINVLGAYSSHEACEYERKHMTTTERGGYVCIESSE